MNEGMIDFVAGWISGAVSILACQPIDTILTRYQAATVAMVPTTPTATNAATIQLVTNGTTGTSTIATAALTTSTNVWRTITMDVYHTLGIRALWRGASPVIAAAPIQNALLMGGYGYGSRYYSGGADNDASRSKQLGAIFFGGCTGGVLQSFLMSPVELIKVIQQCTNATTGNSTYNVTQNIIRNHSSSTIMSGLNATLLRDGIPHGVWFVSYDMSKVTLMSSMSSNYDTPISTTTSVNVENVPVSVSLASGAIAATVAWMVGYPADLIKTRIQSMATAEQKQLQIPLSIYNTAELLIREANGNIWKGLYRGFGMKLVRSIPASMIGFTVYEFVKELITAQRFI